MKFLKVITFKDTLLVLIKCLGFAIFFIILLNGYMISTKFPLFTNYENSALICGPFSLLNSITNNSYIFL